MTLYTYLPQDRLRASRPRHTDGNARDTDGNARDTDAASG